MRITAVAIAVGILATSGAPTGAPDTLPASQRPDLSGTWQVTELDPPGMAEAATSIMGFRFAIRIDGNRIAVTQILRDELVTMELEAGGAPVRSRQPGIPCQGDWFPFWTAAWDGNTLVLTHIGSEPAGGGGSIGPAVGARRLRLTSPISLLVERAAAPGEQGRVVGSIYARVSVPVGTGLPPPPVTKASATIANVAWIAGSWKTTNTTAPISNEEIWMTPQFGSMMGIARGLGKSALVRYEFLCMVERDGSLLYHHAPNGQMVGTRYTLTLVSADSATFENPMAGYPKIIRYTRRPDGSLEIATEDAGGKDVRFQRLSRQ